MAQRDVGIDCRCSPSWQVAGTERGKNQRDGNDHQHPGIDGTDVNEQEAVGLGDAKAGEEGIPSISIVTCWI
jgi:hypothetical protein